MKEPSTQNNFAVLSIPEEQVLSVLKEGDVPISPFQLNEEVRSSPEPALKIPVEGHSPTYVEMEKKINLLTILVHLKKINQRSHPKKGENLKRQFERKNSNALRCKGSNQL